MFFPLKSPNLPSSKVTAVAVSGYSDKLLDKLNDLSIFPIITKESPLVELIGYHTDLFVLNCKHGELLLDRSQSSNIVKFLTIGYDAKILNKKIHSPYATECMLNCVVLGKKLIYNPQTVCRDVLTIADENGYKLIPVNQGYTKCSICIVNDNALITDDESINNACKLNGIDSVLISKGSVKLEGFNYGFIGGCTGLIDKNKLLFNGDINYHTDCNRIIDFLAKYDVAPMIIENEPLTDIGSIIPLCEKPL